jgi:hypothetical protein
MQQNGRFKKGLRLLAALKIKETDGEPIEVENNLFIGSIGAAINNDRLDGIGITHILSLCGDIGYKKLGHVEYKYYNVSDKPRKMSELSSILQECLTYVDNIVTSYNNNKCKKILIHCMMGKSRSATIVIAYLMHKKKMGWMDALSYLRSKRPIVEPNLGFISLLKHFEKKIMLKK